MERDVLTLVIRAVWKRRLEEVFPGSKSRRLLLIGFEILENAVVQLFLNKAPEVLSSDFGYEETGESG
jgi:hypothetical protein